MYDSCILVNHMEVQSYTYNTIYIFLYELHFQTCTSALHVVVYI